MYMHYLNHMPEQIINHMTFTSQNTGTIIAWVLCMTFGYLLYTHALKQIIREKVDPYPLYLHCWMITIDSTSTVFNWYLAFHYHFFWLFVLMGIGLPIWVCLEAYCIYFGVRYHRQEEFQGMTKGPVSVKQATIWALGMVAISYTINWWFFSMVGGIQNAAWFISCPFTNYVFTYWTWRLWTKRATETGTRYGNSMGLQIIILVQVTLMWIPKLSWYLDVTPFFNEPWYYLAGIGSTCLALYNLYHCAKLAPKKQAVNGKKPLW